MSPLLEKMANDDPDVVLRKIDIVNWESEVAAQYKIRSIPDVRVFDRSGKQQRSPGSDLKNIAALVSKSK